MSEAEKKIDPMTGTVEGAAGEDQRQRFWEDYHAAYAALQANPQAWAEFQAEMDSWDTTLGDGLEHRIE